MSIDFVGSQTTFSGIAAPRVSLTFSVAKRFMDVAVSLALLPLVAVCAVLLLVMNPIPNRGRLFFRQIRMGRGGRAFVAYKFRSIKPGHGEISGPYGPVETSCITPLGRALRRSRIDELPQVINVLLGNMSLIGPRPDCIHHARFYLRDVPDYRARLGVRPEISGYAQTEVGYA
ncbi:sugar transferase [Ruegeria arenilitoris]|uniref:sugar transferase n=1 Tax=Ruegeria arenilitoris TaxID=1173585 RepID=UPI00147BA046|nr:sugar transferase [Ruegeria arenilitoris]